MRSALMTLSSLAGTVSIDQERQDEPALRSSLADPHPADPAAEATVRSARNRLQELLVVMPRRSAEILSLRFGLDGSAPRSLREIGETVHLSRERVRQIEAEALELLRNLFDGDALPEG